MDNRYYDNIINEMKPFLDENGFIFDGDIFKNDKTIAKISYNDEKQMYILSTASISEDEESPEFSEISAWLFDDSQNEKDAISVGIDFTNSLRKHLGIKLSRTTAGKKIDLPTASKSDSMSISGFAKKMLDFYPVLKDEYKAHISIYGNFLYLNFFGEKLIPCIKDTLVNGNKKQVIKLFDIFTDGYFKGDKDTVNTIVAVLCAASYNDSDINEKIKTQLEENKHFLSSYNNFLNTFSKNKKLKEALIKY